MSLSSLTPAQLEALLNGPALAPPPGVTPQLDNPPNKHDAAVAVQIVCIVVATLALFMRMYTKIRIIRNVNSADYAIILGWGVFVGYFVPSWLLSSVAAAVHQYDLRLKYLEPFLKYVHVGSIMYGICIFLIKLSILLQYMQLFPSSGKRDYMWWSCWTLIVANFIFYFVSSFIEIFSCHPIAKAWNPFITDGWCINVFALNIAASSINTVSDVILLLLPQTVIWRLHMSLRNRLGASAVFLVGIFATASSAVRLAYVVVLSRNSDITYYTWFAGVWTYPEMTAGIVVACLPVSLRFFKNIRTSRFVSNMNDTLRSLIGRGRSSGSSTSNRNNPNTTAVSAVQQNNQPPPPKAGIWSRIYADLDDTLPGTTVDDHDRDPAKPNNTAGVDGVYVIRSVETDAFSARGSSSVGHEGEAYELQEAKPHTQSQDLV